MIGNLQLGRFLKCWEKYFAWCMKHNACMEHLYKASFIDKFPKAVIFGILIGKPLLPSNLSAPVSDSLSQLLWMVWIRDECDVDACSAPLNITGLVKRTLLYVWVSALWIKSCVQYPLLQCVRIKSWWWFEWGFELLSGEATSNTSHCASMQALLFWFVDHSVVGIAIPKYTWIWGFLFKNCPGVGENSDCPHGDSLVCVHHLLQQNFLPLLGRS